MEISQPRPLTQSEHDDALAKRVAACAICLAIGGMTVTTMLVALPGAMAGSASVPAAVATANDEPVARSPEASAHTVDSEEPLTVDAPSREKFDPKFAAMTTPGY